MNHIAIDVHDQYSQVCVMSPAKEILLTAKVATTKAALSDFFRQRERSRVIYEAGPHALWIGELLEELGHETVACHARRIRLIAESRNKNDRVDAEVLARLSLSDLELIRPIRQRSRQTLNERAVTTTRATLVETRKTLRNTLRGLVKPFGTRLPKGKKAALAEASKADLPEHVRQSVEALLKVITALAVEIDQLETSIEKMADRPEIKRMRTVPGVGPLVAVAFRHVIDDPYRFAAKDVGAYLGLTPANRSSAGKKLSSSDRGRPGDPYVRSLLIQSAWTLINSRSRSDLALWAKRKLTEIGSKKAPVAVARKLAVLLHHLWLHDQDFLPNPSRGNLVTG